MILIFLSLSSESKIVYEIQRTYSIIKESRMLRHWQATSWSPALVLTENWQVFKVSNHGKGEVAKGTLNAIKRAAGI